MLSFAGLLILAVFPPPCTHSFTLDERTGGGFGAEGQTRPDQLQFSCVLTDGTVSRLPCHGVASTFDMKFDGSTVSITPDDGSGAVHSIVSFDLDFRELAVAFTLVPNRSLTYHFVDSFDYSDCTDFAASPTGVAFCTERFGLGLDACVVADTGCSVLATGAAAGWYDACADVCEQPMRSEEKAAQARRRRHVKAAWEFTDGLQGWANSSFTEMQAEVYPRGGELRGVVLGKSKAGGASPHVDSPRLALTVNDKHHLVVRMQYTGPAKLARLLFRTGQAVLPELLPHGLASWEVRKPNATAVKWSHPGQDGRALVDGNPHTAWSTADNPASGGDAWVVVDLGGHFPVTELDLTVSFGQSGSGHASRSLRLQVGSSADANDFRTVFSFAVDSDNSNSSHSAEADAAAKAVGDDTNPGTRYTHYFDLESKHASFEEKGRFAGFGGGSDGGKRASGDGSGTYRFTGIANTFGRFFRLYCPVANDESGAVGSSLEVRELALRGPEDTIVQMEFPIRGDGEWHTYSVPFHEKVRGLLTQIRFYPAIPASKSTSWQRGTGGVPLAFQDVASEDELRATFNPNYPFDPQNQQGGGGGGDEDVFLPSSPRVGNAFGVDWIRIAVAPTVMRVTGCQVNKYFDNENLASPTAGALTTTATLTNDFLKSSSFTQASWEETVAALRSADEKGLPYATTYNCLRGGGQVITLRGKHLGGGFDDGYGGGSSLVSVGGQPCLNVQTVVPEYELKCTLPPFVPSFRPQNQNLKFDSLDAAAKNVAVTVTLADLPLLQTSTSTSPSSVPMLSYTVSPPLMRAPTLSNLAARSVDVSWVPPGSFWDHLTLTGYVLRVREMAGSGRQGQGQETVRDLVLGNVTTTTVTALLPGTTYAISVASVCGNHKHANGEGGGGGDGPPSEWTRIDLYGRRLLVDLDGYPSQGNGNAVVSGLSVEANLTATLRWDVSFPSFTANSSLVNHGAIDPRASLGPTGVVGGEGAYGLVVVGDANIENCNSSVACCDAFNYSLGVSSCAAQAYTCSQAGATDPYYVNGVDTATSTSQVPSNDVDGSQSAAKQVQPWAVASKSRNALRPVAPCGPALRLTSSHARQSGSVWYSRQLNVEEGFESVFQFRVAEPSVRCNSMDDAYTHCRARGGDGLAFVVQNQDGFALGAGGAGLGYTGIANSVAVEFDTFFNAELVEPYENHVAVHSRGWRHANNANHSYAFSSSVSVADLSRNTHTAKVVYKPTLDVSAVLAGSGSFDASAHLSHFLENADFPNGGMADFGTGMGQLEVYVDDLTTPLLVTPLNLGSLLKLHHGRAWVGFTAATGQSTWQTQDLLSWHFNQLRLDKAHSPPPVVNGVGAFACADPLLCVHQ